MTRQLNEDSYLGVKPATLALVAVFIATTFISVGILINQTAQASARIDKHDDEIGMITKDRAESTIKYYDRISAIEASQARTEAKVDLILRRMK